MLKKATIYIELTPILKKGDRSKAENYRPVSLTSIACKALERIITSSIVKHLHTKMLKPYSKLAMILMAYTDGKRIG